MHFKRIIKAFLAVVICTVLTMLPLSSFAVFADEEPAEEMLFNGNIYYMINSSGEIVITRSRASVTEAVIPPEIDGFPVTEIRNSAFQGKTRLRSVVIPDTVRSIGDYAFFQCTRLEEISIPCSVKEIGWSILKGTPWLASRPDGCIMAGDGIVIGFNGDAQTAQIPYGTRAVAGCAFENAKSIMSVSIPETVTSIGGLAFSGCSKLTECNIPEGVESVGAYAFNWCEALQKVEFADSVMSVGSHMFLGCKALISVNLPARLKRIETAMFMGCTNLRKVILPESVTEIGNQSFMECVSLNELVLRRNVSSVGADAFSGCTGLRRITINNSRCRIYDSENTIPQNTVISGLRDSSAQVYANKYERQFVPASLLYGDVNGDGVIDINDAAVILGIYAKRGAAFTGYIDEYEIAAADVDRDGEINISDAALVLRIYAENGAGIRSQNETETNDIQTEVLL